MRGVSRVIQHQAPSEDSIRDGKGFVAACAAEALAHTSGYRWGKTSCCSGAAARQERTGSPSGRRAGVTSELPALPTTDQPEGSPRPSDSLAPPSDACEAPEIASATRQRSSARAGGPLTRAGRARTSVLVAPRNAMAGCKEIPPSTHASRNGRTALCRCTCVGWSCILQWKKGGGRA